MREIKVPQCLTNQKAINYYLGQMREFYVSLKRKAHLYEFGAERGALKSALAIQERELSDRL